MRTGTPLRGPLRRVVCATTAVLAGGILTVAPLYASAAPMSPRLAAVSGSKGLANPSKSMHPSHAFKVYCFESNHASQCNAAALADINKARAAEGLRKMTLPKDFYKLSTTEQLETVSNRERNIRGLATMPMNSKLNSYAQQGAKEGTDPNGPDAYSWGSNISWGYFTPLAADFAWMYDDGPNSPNVACAKAGDAGCWGHRDNILSRWKGDQGDGYYNNDGTPQLTQLFVQDY
jgi:hypothetical protein